MKLLVALTLLLTSHNSNALDYALGAQIGGCDGSRDVRICQISNGHVWHVYAKAKSPITRNVGFVMAAHHFSHFNWPTDWERNTADQTGAFNYYGAGLEMVF